MKSYKVITIIVFFIAAFILGCNSTQKKEAVTKEAVNNGKAIIQFDKTVHDFGKISEGEIVTFTFLFKNTGDANLFVNNVKASCGCTTPDWTKEPVKPGEKGKVVVSFDSSGRNGSQQKIITVYSNSSTKNAERLTIAAEIINNQ